MNGGINMLMQNILFKDDEIPLYGECGCCKNLATIDKRCRNCKDASMYQSYEKYPIQYKIFWDKKRGLRYYSPEKSELEIGKYFISIDGGRMRFQICKVIENNNYVSGKGLTCMYYPYFSTPCLEYRVAKISTCYVVFGEGKVHCFEDDVEQAMHFAKQVNGLLQIHLG